MPTLTDDFDLNAITKVIIDLVLSQPTLVNLDFNDINNMLGNSTEFAVGVGSGKGVYKGIEAAQNAIKSPMLANLSPKSARRILIQITGGKNLTLADTNNGSTEIFNRIAHEDADALWGVNIDENLTNEMIVKVFATEFSTKVKRKYPSFDEIIVNIFKSYRTHQNSCLSSELNWWRKN